MLDNKPPVILSHVRDDLDIFPGTDTLEGYPTWVIHDKVRGKFFNIGVLEYEILRRWHLGSIESIADDIVTTTTYYASEDDVKFLNDYLIRNELIKITQASEGDAILKKYRDPPKKNWKSYLPMRHFIRRFQVLKPDRFLTNTLWIVRPVFSKWFWYGIFVVLALGLFLVIRQWPFAVASFNNLFTLGGVFSFLAAIVVAKAFHEFGHAYTAKYHGVAVPTMGVMLMIIIPLLFTDTSESWKLKSRKKRIQIGAAGMLAEFILACFATLLWGILSDGYMRDACFFLATTAWVSTLAINLSPFLKWDGYYIFSDLIGVQNLAERGMKYARWKLREWLFKWGEKPPHHFDKRTSRLVLFYAFGAMWWRFTIFISIGLLIFERLTKVLGIMMLTLQVVTFIIAPIASEVIVWFKEREKMRWNVHSVTTLMTFIILIALLVTPWQSVVRVPAVITPETYTQVYTPNAAQVVEVYGEQNHTVRRGQKLIQLANKDLLHSMRLAQNEIKIQETELARYGDKDYFESRNVTIKVLQEAVERLKGLEELKSELTVYAPFDGLIITKHDALRPGTWFPANELVMTVADTSDLRVIGYIPEEEINRIDVSETATFYPENPRVEAITVDLISVDPAETGQLKHGILSTTNGGVIAVQTAQGSTRNSRVSQPVKPHYKIVMSIRDENSLSDISVIQRGSLHIKSERQSLLQRLWRNTVAIVIRESGF